MNNVKLLLRVCLIYAFVMFVGLMCHTSVYAAKTVTKDTTVILSQADADEENDDIDISGEYTNNDKIDFKTTSTSYLMFAFSFETSSGAECSKGSIRFVLKDSQGNILEDDKISTKNCKVWYDDWLCTSKKVSPSQYSWTVYNNSDETIELKYTVKEYSDVAKKATIKNKKSVKSSDWVKIGKIDNLPWIKNVKLSSKKILYGWDIDPDGSVYIRGKKPGTATATVILKNGKKYKCKVTVKPSDPNFGAYLEDYYTRDNYFTVRIKNNGISDLKIIRSGRVINSEYKSFDRKLRSMSSVTIKPGKSKTVRFYCKGTTTWYDASQYTIYAKVKYQGKTHVWHVWDEDSVIKKGKSWYNTYWDEDWYKEWNPI